MSKTLVAYFSASGISSNIAKKVSEYLESSVYEIKPPVPYTAEDLDYRNSESITTIENKDKSIRPTLSDHDAKVEEYDNVVLCFPIWWYSAPTIVYSFLDAYDFSNKKVIVCATSGGSDFGKTEEEIKAIIPNASVLMTKCLNRFVSSDDEAINALKYQIKSLI